MAKFRKKPVVIDAIQWNGGVEVIDIFHMAGESLPRDGYKRVLKHNMADGTLTISTLEGDMVASLGDWIIRGVQGEVYPCKPDIFEQTYEAVDD